MHYDVVLIPALTLHATPRAFFLPDRYLADVEGYDPDHKLHSLRYADGFVEHIDLDQVTCAHTCPSRSAIQPLRLQPLVLCVRPGPRKLTRWMLDRWAGGHAGQV